MPASAIKTTRPPGTAVAWATKEGLFCEIPCQKGPSYIIKYPLTTRGLQQALGVLVVNEAPIRPEGYPQKDHPQIVRGSRYTNGHKAQATTAAAEVVRKMRRL